MAGNQQVILIGEPDPATTALYQRALSTAFTVLAAPDEASLLQLLYTMPVAALVLELALFPAPGWDEVTAISRVCAEQGVPLVVCSTLDERRRGLALGATAYLVKPTLPATLLDTLREVMESKEHPA
jgi:DNA-binding response OmpR family regulator